jgi:hypothetical protein
MNLKVLSMNGNPASIIYITAPGLQDSFLQISPQYTKKKGQ